MSKTSVSLTFSVWIIVKLFILSEYSVYFSEFPAQLALIPILIDAGFKVLQHFSATNANGPFNELAV